MQVDCMIGKRPLPESWNVGEGVKKELTIGKVAEVSHLGID